MNKCLEGVRVIELSVYASAPWCGRMLADMGAEVIKIEGPGGDPQRAFGTFANTPASDVENPCYLVENSGKKSICLDLKSVEGKEVLFKLLETADIFFTNTRMGALERLGLTYDDLKERFPRLIYGHLSGYGLNGKDAVLPGFDSTAYFARVGALVDNAYEGRGPMGTVYGVGDNTTGTALCAGLLAALYKQQRTGEGELVLVSLFGTAVSIFGLDLVSTQDGEGYNERYPKQWENPPTPVCTTYMCPGGAISLGLLTHEKFWPGFCKAVEHEEWIEDPRFSTRDAIATAESKAYLVPILAEIFESKDIEHWIKVLSEQNIPFGIARHFKDVHNDTTAWENGYLNKFTFDNGHTINVPSTPVFFKEFGARAVPPVGNKGADTEMVLKNLGYSADEIQKMRESKAIV